MTETETKETARLLNIVLNVVESADRLDRYKYLRGFIDGYKKAKSEQETPPKQ